MYEILSKRIDKWKNLIKDLLNLTFLNEILLRYSAYYIPSPTTKELSSTTTTLLGEFLYEFSNRKQEKDIKRLSLNSDIF